MNSPDPYPVSVDLIRADNRLEISWEDGARSAYAGATLRWVCPCADCRGEAGLPGRLDRIQDLPADELRLTSVELVGHYALQLGFASGHATGIYTFRHLRSLADASHNSARRWER